MDILVQDRDLIVKLNKGQLNMETIKIDGIFYGVNVRHGKTLLGNYDDLEEAFEQFCNIINCKDDLYRMDGYSNFSFEDLENF